MGWIKVWVPYNLPVSLGMDGVWVMIPVTYCATGMQIGHL